MTCRPAGGSDSIRNFACVWVWRPKPGAAKEHNWVCLSVRLRGAEEVIELPGTRASRRPTHLNDDLAGAGVC